MSPRPSARERLPRLLGGERGPLAKRILGIPLLFAVGYAAVGFSLYFSIGLVADRGLGLTPVVFLAAGVLFVLATLTYVEGGAMYPERGGSSMLARHAFNELVSFIAGWAILIEYVIVIALASISFAQYLSPIWGGFTHGAGELVAIGVVIVVAAAANIVGSLGRQALVLALAIGDIALQLALIIAGLFVALHPDLLTDQVTLFQAPSIKDLAIALAVATVAFAGIEATSDLAPDIDWGPRDLRRMVGASSMLLPLVYAGISAIALMAVPVTAGAGGRPHTELAGRYIEEPLLGVVKSYDPSWLSTGLEVLVVVIAPAVLLWAASTSMLGLSRHVYALAVHRQVPSWLGKLGKRRSTPHVAIVVAAVMAFGLAVPGDVRLLAGFYAFGSTLAITIAHLSILKLRVSEPDLAKRPFVVPWNVRIRGHLLPVPAIAGAILMAAGWVSVVLLRQGARDLGFGWMAFGLIAYVIYRRYVEGTSLTEVVEVPASALHKDIEEAEYETILVPVFGTELDDDIVSTAGRLADTADEPGERNPKLEVIYVMDLPLTVPLNAKPPKERQEEANQALERATAVGSEYETVDVDTAVVRARSIGAGIVEEARRRNAELIVMGAEPPSKVRGGDVLGGTGRGLPPEIGEATQYVLSKAPCRVLVTAPPASVDGAVSGDGAESVAG